jgi:transposase
MPRPHSTDLRQRALPACEQDEDDFTAIARRFRVGVSTLRLWRRQAREEGRRAPRRMGRGPAPLDGGLLALSQLVAERNDATLAECAGLLAARTGKPKRSAPPLSFQRALGSLEPSTAPPALCRALKRLGWVRKQRRRGPANRTAWTWRPAGPRGATRRPGSTRPGSSSSTRAASTRA